MGNKIFVDKFPNSIESIIKHTNIKEEEISKLIDHNKILLSSYQKLNFWSLSENQNSNQKILLSNPIDLSNISTKKILESHNVYIILLIYKKDTENMIENSPFPTGLWGIIESSSSNMTPRGLLYAFPANNNNSNSNTLNNNNINNNNNSQNLETFLLSKRELNDSEFKYMLFIWNGKQSSAYLRSIALMKAFDLDKSLNSEIMVKLIYSGIEFKENEIKISECVKIGEMINDIKNSSERSGPSSEKINNLHETVYLFKWLYPIEKKEKKSEKKNHKIMFKGINNYFLENPEKKDFYSNFIDLNTDNIKNIEKNNNNNIINDNDNNDIKNNNINSLNLKKLNINKNDNKNNNNKEKSNLSNSLKASNNTTILPPKLHLNLNNKLNLNSNSSNNNKNAPPNSKSSQINNLPSNNSTSNNEEKEISLDDDINLDLNDKVTYGKMPSIKMPKLMVSLQHNIINEEIITERTKKKEENEESLNELPESILITASEHILKEEKDKIDIKALNEDYNLKDGDRKKIINDYYSKHLSEILPNFMYLCSYNAAKNLELLKENKITHIINCAADFCNNVFPNDFTYLSFNLKDHVMEDIECLFYECITFIENVKNKNGRVLIHCIQGISRSVSIVLAYLIYKEKYTYDIAFNHVQQIREISSPNFGFSIQLQNFYLRLYDKSSFRFYPKIFGVGSFQNEQPEKIVCRLITENFFEMKENGKIRMFDKRGVFIICCTNCIYIWIGSKISEENKEIYTKCAKDYILYLQKYEGENNNIKIEEEGKESKEFLKDLLKSDEKIKKFKNLADIFVEWNNWYKEIIKKSSLSSKGDSKNSKENNKTITSVDDMKKSFFLYPNLTADSVLDFDDLNDSQFLIACVLKNKNGKIYLWKGKDIEIGKNKEIEFKNKVIQKFFKEYFKESEFKEKIEEINEVPMEESDDFLNLLY